MKIWIKQAQLVSNQNLESRQDILIENGIIEYLGAPLDNCQADVTYDFPGLYVSPGWIDVGVQIGDPGYEHREDLHSAMKAATAGGFTQIACFPNTFPPTHSKSEIQYIQSRSTAGTAQVFPIGAISQDLSGKDLAELYDMHEAGALAFSDGLLSVQDAGLMLRALQYVKAFDGLIVNRPFQKSIAGGGQMHEGLVSTMLGLKGIPALAETLMIQRDISLLRYAGGRLLIHLVSTAEGLELVRKAKQEGLAVSCSVALANLCFDDEKLLDFDSNWKLMPPLRSSSDRQALVEGVLDGAIDLICSNHVPWDEEHKNLEFPYAEFGMTGLETLFSCYEEYLSPKIPLTKFIEMITYAPRKLLRIPSPELRVGAKANLTLFQSNEKWTYTASKSKSRNTPMLGADLVGKVIATVS